MEQGVGNLGQEGLLCPGVRRKMRGEAMRGIPLSSELTHCPSFELLHRQGRDQAASLRGRGGKDRVEKRGRKRTWVPETIDPVNLVQGGWLWVL